MGEVAKFFQERRVRRFHNGNASLVNHDRGWFDGGASRSKFIEEVALIREFFGDVTDDRGVTARWLSGGRVLGAGGECRGGC